MPTGPKGQKRPADVIGAAVMVAKIATGEITETVPESPLSPAAELGRKGGKARAAALSKKKRTEIARKAAAGRWGSKHRTRIAELVEASATAPKRPASYRKRGEEISN